MAVPNPRESCAGKRRMPSKEMADEFVAYVRSHSGEAKRRAKRLGAYQCRRCGYWHIGHTRAH